MESNTRQTGSSALRRALAASALAMTLVLPYAANAVGTGRVDLNTASLEQLQELPGIGPSKAEAILEERKKGRFASVEDLERVKGIGPSIMTQLRDHVSVAAEAAK